MTRIVLRMIKTEGILSLYSGFIINLARLLPNSAILFIMYETLSNQLGLENE